MYLVYSQNKLTSKTAPIQPNIPTTSLEVPMTPFQAGYFNTMNVGGMASYACRAWCLLQWSHSVKIGKCKHLVCVV